MPDVTNSPEAEEIELMQDHIIDTVVVGQQEVLDTLESATLAVVEGVSRTQWEIADFLARRIREDLDTQQALMRCRSFDELADVQTKFLRTAVDEYGDEASRLLKLGGELAVRTLEKPRI